METRMMVAHAPSSLVHDGASSGLERPEATAAASRSSSAGRQVHIIAPAARELRNGGAHDWGVFMIEVEEFGAELRCVEWVRGHWCKS